MLYLKDLNTDKRYLRDFFSGIRKEMTDEERRNCNKAVTERFLNSECYLSSSAVMAYYSRLNEVSTLEIIQKAFLDGKRVALPACGSSGLMDFYFIDSLDCLFPGRFGIPEPKVSELKKAEPDESFVCLVPGLAFDASGNRLGFGGGYYDRYLAAHPVLRRTVGLSYDNCLCDALPVEKHDIPAAFIVSENNFFEIK